MSLPTTALITPSRAGLLGPLLPPPALPRGLPLGLLPSPSPATLPALLLMPCPPPAAAAVAAVPPALSPAPAPPGTSGKGSSCAAPSFLPTGDSRGSNEEETSPAPVPGSDSRGALGTPAFPASGPEGEGAAEDCPSEARRREPSAEAAASAAARCCTTLDRDKIFSRSLALGPLRGGGTPPTWLARFFCGNGTPQQQSIGKYNLDALNSEVMNSGP